MIKWAPHFLITLACVISLVETTIQAKDKKDEESQQIEKLEQDWFNAYVKSDATVLDKIEADDFILNDPSGAAKTKADDIRDIKSGAMKWSEGKVEELKIRVYGKTAIATGVAAIKGTYTGQDISGRYRFIDVFVRKKDEWKAVSSQVTAVAMKK